jgi:hypothetical protein
MRALGAAAEGTIPPGTFNLGSGLPMTIRALAEMIGDGARALGLKPELVAPAPDGPAPAPYRVLVGRLAAAGFRAETPVRAAVDETLRFCAEHRRELAA